MFTLRPTETNSKFIKLFKKEEKKKLVFLSFERLNGVSSIFPCTVIASFFGGGLFTMNLSTSPTTFDMYV